jgi:hypothetical protein
MIMVWYADDFVAGFQYENDDRRFWNELRERLGSANRGKDVLTERAG